MKQKQDDSNHPNIIHMYKGAAKLLLSSLLLFMNGCEKKEMSLEEKTSLITPVEIQYNPKPIYLKNPFYEGQPIDEKRQIIMEMFQRNETLSNQEIIWLKDLLPYLERQNDLTFLFDTLNTFQVFKVPFSMNINQKEETLGACIYPLILLDNQRQTDENVFKHEFIHLTMKSIMDKGSEQYGLEEALTTILEEEYGICDTSYRSIATMTRMILELVGSDPFYEMLETGSIEPLLQALQNIGMTDICARQVLEEIELAYQNKENFQPSSFLEKIELYYSIKYGESMYEDKTMNYYIHFLNKTPLYIHRKEIYPYLCKPYLNENRTSILYGYDSDFETFTALPVELDDKKSYTKKR